MKRFLVVVGLMAASFLIGYLPQQMEGRRLADELTQVSSQRESDVIRLEERLAISNLQNELGMVLLELGRNNSGRAQALAGEYFDGVSELGFMFSDPDVAEQLREIGRRRDAITLGLASPTPDTTRQLNEIYLQMSQLLD
jgi:hypothetical protein